VHPDLLLLDEPFVSLDDALALRLRDELAELVTRRPVTTLLVTHNVEEAIALADRLFLLSPSPARVIAELPIERPRSPRSPAELTGCRPADCRAGRDRRHHQGFHGSGQAGGAHGDQLADANGFRRGARLYDVSLHACLCECMAGRSDLDR